MPTIYKPKKKDNRIKRDNRKDNLNHSSVYNTTIWRELRINHLSKNPLCSECYKKGIINLANEVHHIIPISTVDTIEDKKKIGFDPKNLESICSECHKNIHKEI